MHKHMYRLKQAARYSDKTMAYYQFECETCMKIYHNRTDDLWPKPVRVLRDIKLESISITPTGMGQIISVTPQMVGDVKTAAKRDLLMRRRGW